MQQFPPLIANAFASPVGEKLNLLVSMKRKKMISQNDFGEDFQLNPPLRSIISLKKAQSNLHSTTLNTKINQISENDWADCLEHKSILLHYSKK